MHIKKTILAVVLLMALSIPSLVQNAAAAAKNKEKGKILDSSPIAEVVDKNKDGIMSHAEWTAAGLSDFGLSVMDLNKDDNVTLAEMMDPECDAPPDGIDKNNDGKIQFDEFFAVVGVKKDTGSQQGSKPAAGPQQ